MLKELNQRYSGGYSSEVPPLPIPNREVKLTHADGTAIQCGRVGSRRFSVRVLLRSMPEGDFLRLYISYKTNAPSDRNQKEHSFYS